MPENTTYRDDRAGFLDGFLDVGMFRGQEFVPVVELCRSYSVPVIEIRLYVHPFIVCKRVGDEVIVDLGHKTIFIQVIEGLSLDKGHRQHPMQVAVD